MVYKTLEDHNILWFAVDNILPSEALMVSNSTTGTFLFTSQHNPFSKGLLLFLFSFYFFKKVKKFFVADPFFLLCGGKGGKFYVENGSSGHERRSGQLGCGASFEMAGL